MDPIIEFVLGAGGWPAGFVGVLTVVYWLTHDSHTPGAARDRWIGWLETDYAGARYRAMLGAALDWIDSWLSPDADPAHPDRTEVARAWSHGLLDFSLLCAVAYPVLMLLGQWAWTGAPGRLGALVVLEAEEAWHIRAAAIGAVVMATVGGRQFLVASTLQQHVLAAGLAIVAVAVVLAVAVPVSIAVVGAVSVAGAVAVTGAAGPVAVAAAFAAAIAIAVAGALPVAGAVAGALAGVAFMASFAFAVAGAFATDWLGRRTGRPMACMSGFVAILSAALCVVVILSPTLGHGAPRVDSLILFLGFLPLINAVADFASTGLTRHRLRCGLTGSPWREAAVDVVAGLAILMLLGFAMIAGIHWVRPQDGTAMADLPRLFADLRADPGAYWWLYLMLFSTLVPTFLHLCVACLGFFTLYPSGLRRWIAGGLAAGERDPQYGRLATLALSVAITLALVAPFFLLWQAGTHAGAPVLSAMLDLFEGFARLIGAV